MKVVFVGDNDSGKNQVLQVLECGKLLVSEDYNVSFNTISIRVEYQNKYGILHLYDTTGQEDYDRLRPLSYPNTDIFVLCFHIDEVCQLDNIQEKWAPEVKSYCPKARLLLLGTKKHLRYDEEYKKQMEERGKEFLHFSANFSKKRPTPQTPWKRKKIAAYFH
jgi:small GTP-binding protein